MNPRAFLNRASALTAARILQDLTRFLLLLWLARTDQAGFGLLTFGMGLSFLVFSLLDLGLDQYTLREFSKTREPPQVLLNGLLRFKILLGLILILGVAGVLSCQGWEPRPLALILGICLSKALDGCSESLLSVFRARGRQVTEAGITGAAALLGTGYGGVLLLWGRGAEAVVQSLVLIAGARLAAVMINGRRTGLLSGVSVRPLLQGDWSWFREHRRGLLAFAAIFALGAFFNRIQPLLLKQYFDLNEVALFGAAYDLTGGVLAVIASLVLGRVLFPVLVEASCRDQTAFSRMIGNHSRRLVLIGLGLTFFFHTRGAPLLVLLYGSGFHDGGAVVRIMSPSITLSLLNNYLMLVFLAEGRHRLLLGSLGSAALSSLILGYVLIPTLGARGAALDLLLSRGILTLFLLIAAQLRYGLLRSPSNFKAALGPLILGGTYLGLAGWDFLWAVRISLSLYAIWLWHMYFRGDLKQTS